jgi:hypothetical protein
MDYYIPIQAVANGDNSPKNHQNGEQFMNIMRCGVESLYLISLVMIISGCRTI